ncbi:MAG: efflux RND transporter permease subunit [Desulfobacteraceae bacterium]|nr:efflux RND transporter permease subunit [Desulfobacteraceae bacterium]
MMLTKFSLKNNVLTLSILVVLILSGLSAFNSMPRDDMPSFLIRYMSVVTTYPGASPERIENLISDKIEKVVQEVPQVDYITSESRTGISIVTISLKDNVADLQPIFDRLRRKVESIQSDLPDGAVVSIDDEVGDVFGIIVGLTAEGYSYSEIKDIADDIRDEFIKLPEAAKVEINGYQKEKIYIDFNDAKFADIGLTKVKLDDLISKTNIIIPGGEIRLGDQRIILEPTGNFEQIRDLENIIISSKGGQTLRLRDVSTIRRGYEEPQKRLVRINGKPGVSIAINLKQEGNIISLGKQVDQIIAELKQVYPYGVEFGRIASQDIVVEKSVNDFIGNLLQSVVVVLIVMLIFLGFRTGAIVASLIPSAIILTLLLMSVSGTGINQVTLASLIIALGMLVDNAIVMSESIMVRMENGKKAYDSAIESAKELSLPLLTSSVTTSAAFMAFFLAESVMGEIMGNIFVVVSFALLGSWILTLTIIALFCVKGLKVKQKNQNKPDVFERLSKYYRKALVFCLKRSAVTIISVLMMFVISIFLFRFVPFIFMPKSDKAIVTVNFELPIGTAIEKTEESILQVETFIKEKLLYIDNEEAVLSWSSYIGEGAPKYDLGYNPPESSPNAAHILINTVSDAANDKVIQALDQFILNSFPDAKYRVSRLISGGGSVDPIAVRLAGKDLEKLYQMSESVKEKIRQIEGSKNTSDNWGMKTKKLVIDIHPETAQLAGVTNQDIALSLQTILSGTQTGSYREGDKSIPILLKNSTAGILKVEELETINIYAQQSGKNVSLKQVADIKVVWQPTKILRRDQQRTITITSDINRGYTASQITSILTPWLEQESEKWGYGYSFELGGDAEGSSDAMGAVAKKLPISLFIIVLVLIGQFNSIKKPLIILLTIPLGLIGVILGLFITNSYMGFMAFLGIISLAGIVINNAIVLLDRIEIEEKEYKKPLRDAIVDAGTQRFRPIILTTATTSLGLIPLWISGGLMWEPMAISIIFGLLFATLLTLVFVPVLYKIFYNVDFKTY